jgi:hypothetical protein
MLKYCLIDNRMSKDGKNCVAIVSSRNVINLDELLDDIVAEGTGLTRPQALAYFEKMTQLILRYLGKGYFVTTPLFRFRTSITGVFNDKLDTFDPTRNRIKISTTAGTRIQYLNSFVDPEKVSTSKTSPEIFHFIDSATDEINTSGIPGGTARILGTNLRFDKTDPKQGVFFVSVADTNIEYRASIYSGIRPSEIHLTIPALEPGEYTVVIRNMTTNNKEMVTGTLDAVIQFQF